MEPPELREIFGANVRRFVKKRRMSINRLADLAGLSRSSFYRVLNGESSPTLDTICSVADALEVLPRQLLDERR